MLVLACIYIHIHVHNNNSQRKEAINLRMGDMGGSLGGICEGRERRKGRGEKDVTQFQLKNTLCKSRKINAIKNTEKRGSLHAMGENGTLCGHHGK